MNHSANTLPFNICRPDDRKSCAACCGLYNVADGTKEALEAKLHRRTDLFSRTGRSPDELLAFENLIDRTEANEPLDPAIHVCEFTGFVDGARRIVGCLLHPTSPGNEGVDLRGLCHYGSLACRSFYCPSWECLDRARIECIVAAVDDWHLYGLVITDVQFIHTLFQLIEDMIGIPLNPEVMKKVGVDRVLREVLGWKAICPPGTSTSVRRSHYYGKPFADKNMPDRNALMARIADALAFNFGLDNDLPVLEEMAMRMVERFAAVKVPVPDLYG